MSKVFGQSTKESYRDDIETSRKSKTVYKLFEWFDDHSYCTSNEMGVYLCKERYLYLFQGDGPKEPDIFKKFLEWRRSGKSHEIGHKGGGNKRNLYGHNCEDVKIFMKLDGNNVLKCGCFPNRLYDLSTSDIDEETFRSECDSSNYITNPIKENINELPRWYSDTYNLIEKESGISPNFLIRLNLKDIPKEYKHERNWTEMINQIRAKQYCIPIKFKNELLDMDEYETYENIDMVGFNDNNKICEKTEKLYYKIDKKCFYIKYENKYMHVNDRTEENDTSNIIEWGDVNMFIVSKPYADNELKKYNKSLEYTKKLEDFYGIYLKLNDKLTNYLPFDGKLLGESKNNGINAEEGIKNNGRFRMIFNPNKENCINSAIFDCLIHTRDIKATTTFLENSPYKDIITTYKDIYKCNFIKKKQIRDKKIKKEKIDDGGVYLLYMSNGLYKYGLVTDYNNIDDRINKHKNEQIKKINEFINLLNKKEIPKDPNIIVLYKEKVNSPKSAEEKIQNILESNMREKIKLVESNRSKNEVREYFICDDFDYIINDICNLIRKGLK